MPEWHATFARIKGAGRRRSWLTWGEFDGLLRTLGIALTPYHARLALRPAPPEGPRQRGGLRYEQEHVRLACDYARRRFGWNPEEVEHG